MASWEERKVAAKLRAGIVGVGGMGIAHYHARALAAEEEVELAACCDINREILERFAEQHGVANTYTSYDEMLEKERLDIVVICTNELLHASMTIKAAAYKPKAIICEKPMAMNLAEADAMLSACKENGVVLIIGHQRRYMPQYARAKELLDEGVIGKLEQIWASGHPYSSLLVDGTHIVDLIRYYAGDARIEWVMGQVDARSGRVGWQHVLEDASLALIKFETGVRALLTTGGGLHTPAHDALASSPPFEYNRILLQGTTGMIDIRGDGPVEGLPLVTLIKGDRAEPVELVPGTGSGASWHRGVSPHKDLLRCLETGEVHPLSGTSARATLEVLMAIYESARLRQVVTLPLEKGENPLEEMLAERGIPFLQVGSGA